jgi:hypothetical protein
MRARSLRRIAAIGAWSLETTDALRNNSAIFAVIALGTRTRRFRIRINARIAPQTACFCERAFIRSANHEAVAYDLPQAGFSSYRQEKESFT